MQLRVKIFIGFLILIVILLLADAWSIYQMTHGERTLRVILDENYAGLRAGQVMQKGLDNLDDGFVKILAGKWEEGSRLLNSGNEAFEKGLQVARLSLTGNDTQKKLTQIADAYLKMKAAAGQFHLKILAQKDVRWYEATIQGALKNVDAQILDLEAVAGKNLYEANTRLKDQTRRTLMPSIVAMLAAIIFLLIFNFFIDYFLLRPIRQITAGVRDLLEKRRPFQVEIQTEDELGELASAIATLSSQSSLGELEK